MDGGLDAPAPPQLGLGAGMATAFSNPAVLPPITEGSECCRPRLEPSLLPYLSRVVWRDLRLNLGLGLGLT